VLDQRDFIQMRKERKIERQGKVGAVEPDIADDLAAVPFVIIHSWISS
jgi:hypothetical protein